jgi:hypothetical protein
MVLKSNYKDLTDLAFQEIKVFGTRALHNVIVKYNGVLNQMSPKVTYDPNLRVRIYLVELVFFQNSSQHLHISSSNGFMGP